MSWSWGVTPTKDPFMGFNSTLYKKTRSSMVVFAAKLQTVADQEKINIETSLSLFEKAIQIGKGSEKINLRVDKTLIVAEMIYDILHLLCIREVGYMLYGLGDIQKIVVDFWDAPENLVDRKDLLKHPARAKTCTLL